MENQKYENIIIAVDGSEASEKAFEKAIQIAKRNQAQLIVTNVIDSRSFATMEAYDRTLATRAESEAKKLVERFINDAEEAGLTNIDSSIDFGSPKIKIAQDIAQKHDADLIICGATGLNAVERFLIGSVSESITRHAKCDVLVVR